MEITLTEFQRNFRKAREAADGGATVIVKGEQGEWYTGSANAVYQKFEELENTRRSGILCITFAEYDFDKIPDTNTFRAYAKFNVLFTLTK